MIECNACTSQWLSSLLKSKAILVYCFAAAVRIIRLLHMYAYCYIVVGSSFQLGPVNQSTNRPGDAGALILFCIATFHSIHFG